MQISVLFFGKLADAALDRFGKSSLIIDCPESCKTLTDLRNYLSNKSDMLSDEINQPTILFSINQKICTPDQTIQSGDEVAFMSPLSGG